MPVLSSGHEFLLMSCIHVLFCGLIIVCGFNSQSRDVHGQEHTYCWSLCEKLVWEGVDEPEAVEMNELR